MNRQFQNVRKAAAVPHPTSGGVLSGAKKTVSRKLKGVIFGSLASIVAAMIGKWLDMDPEVIQTLILAILVKTGIHVTSQAMVDKEEMKTVAVLGVDLKEAEEEELFFDEPEQGFRHSIFEDHPNTP